MKGNGKILLTGATGFIGSHVMEALHSAGMQVVAFARPHSNASLARSLGVEIRRGDIEDLASLNQAVQGCSQVVHTAALAADWGPRETFFRVNVQGTLNVLEVCRRHNIEHILITGSISSYGEENCLSPKDESSDDRSHYPYFLDRLFPCAFNFYRDSKAEMTRQAIAFAREHRLNLTVLEPAWVYGEREFTTGFYSYVKAVRNGAGWMPGSSRNCFHVIYARDLAKAYVLAVARKLPGVERIIVADPNPHPMHRIFDLFCETAGLKSPRRLPRWAIYPAGLGMELVYTLAGSRSAPMLTRGRVNMFYDSIRFSAEKANRMLGFKCDHSLEEGIRKTVHWYKANSFL